MDLGYCEPGAGFGFAKNLGPKVILVLFPVILVNAS